MATNLNALQTRLPESKVLRRYDEIAQILTGDPDAKASEGVAWVQELCLALEIPSLAKYGVTEDDFPELIQKASNASSMKGNPIELTEQELGEILSRSI
jgi:alcohol dehydrogenase class IV